MLITLDIDEGVVERARQRTAAAAVCNVPYGVRDVFADGLDGEADTKGGLAFQRSPC